MDLYSTQDKIIKIIWRSSLKNNFFQIFSKLGCSLIHKFEHYDTAKTSKFYNFLFHLSTH